MDPSGFTVVIRTPNQKFQDVKIQLSSKSTIIELKRKIESNHPDFPKAPEQKLIYDGKMLIDHHVIDSVIKESNNVVHLVYACTGSSDSTPKDSKPAPTAQATCQPELRHRFTPQTHTSASGQVNGMHEYGAYSQAYADWMQQYQQHYSSYMQYYTAHNPYLSMAQTVQPVAAQEAENLVNQPVADVQQPEQQNRDGGLVVADENGQDWLDLLFALTRFMLMLSIIYFYSTTYRFIIAVSVLLVIYLYQAGVFQVDRRPARAPEQQEENNPQRPATDDNNNNGTESNDDDSGEPEQLPPPPSIFATVLCFVRSFFSSLVPTGGPGVVN